MTDATGGPGDFARVDIDVAPHRVGLTASEVGRGVLAVHRNARRLFRDALTLLEHGRNAGAVSLAVLAHEEAGKPFTIGMAGAGLPQVPPLTAVYWTPKRLWRRIWNDFADHGSKNKTTATLGLFAVLPTRPVPEGKATPTLQEIADMYVSVRERSTYVDCVQGPERWAVPEMLIDHEGAIIWLRGIRVSLGRIAPPAEVARLNAIAEQAVRLCAPERLKALLEWSQSDEARELSSLDLAEQGAWAVEVDGVLARLIVEDGTAAP